MLDEYWKEMNSSDSELDKLSTIDSSLLKLC